MKAYVIGDKDTVLGFQLIGIPGISVSNGNEAFEALKRTINLEGAKIVFISEDLSTQIQDEINTFRAKNEGLIIVEIPSRFGIKGELPSVQKLIGKILKIRV